MSEVARLMHEIDLQCEAMKRLMYSPSVVTSHAIVAHRYAQLGQTMDRLRELIGTDAAEKTVIERYMQVVR